MRIVLALPLTFLAALLTPVAAGAATALTPLLPSAPALFEEDGQPVPISVAEDARLLGPSGDAVFFVGLALGRAEAERAYLVAASDGTATRRLAREYDGYGDPTASADGTEVAYLAGMDRPELRILSTTSGARRRAPTRARRWFRFEGTRNTTVLAATRGGFLVHSDSHLALRAAPGRATLERLPVRIDGDPFVPPRRSAQRRSDFAPAISDNRRQLGYCRSGRGRAAYGVVDQAAGVVRLRSSRWAPAGSCLVSNDGTTVAATVLDPRADPSVPRRFDASLLVVRRGAFRRVRLGRSYGPLVSISPSGRFVIALAQSTRPPYGVRRATPLLLIDVARGQRRTLDAVPGRGSPWSVRSNTFAWFEGEGRVAIDQGTGVSVVSTSTGRATRLTLPRVSGRVRQVDLIGLSRGEAAVAVQMDTSQGTALASAPVAGGQARLLDSHVWIERPRIERSADGTRLLVTAAEGVRTPSPRQIFVTAGPDPLGDPWDVSGFPAR